MHYLKLIIEAFLFCFIEQLKDLHTHSLNKKIKNCSKMNNL